MRNRLAASVIVLFALLSPAIAEDFWDKKPMDKWSKGDVKKLLTDSPWAREYAMSSVQIAQIGMTGGNLSSSVAASTDRGGETNVVTSYTLQLRSARPIRQAVVRESQLASNYDAMKPEQQKEFDARAGQYINLQFPEEIVVYVKYNVTNPAWTQDMIRYWTGQTTEALKNSVYLITPKNERIPLASYKLAQGQAFQFTFARPKEIGPEGALKVEFVHPDRLCSQKETRILVEFPLKKMNAANKLEF